MRDSCLAHGVLYYLLALFLSSSVAVLFRTLFLVDFLSFAHSSLSVFFLPFITCSPFTHCFPLCSAFLIWHSLHFSRVMSSSPSHFLTFLGWSRLITHLLQVSSFSSWFFDLSHPHFPIVSGHVMFSSLSPPSSLDFIPSYSPSLPFSFFPHIFFPAFIS